MCRVSNVACILVKKKKPRIKTVSNPSYIQSELTALQVRDSYFKKLKEETERKKI